MENFENTKNCTAIPAENKKIVAGIFALFFGYLGIHKFYLGYKRAGLTMLLFTILTAGLGAIIMSIISTIEGVIYLTRTNSEFYQKYQIEKRTWF